ncbi:MAG: MBL fold metallo-hydrolase [Gammaproteobacteria bacterium]|nr:MBL fold metallo-hydrolase [Gammaproteobacteria bacterium]
MRLALIIFSGLLFLSDLSAKTIYPATGVEMTLKQVSKHVYYVQGKAGIATDNEGFISNAGFVVTKEGVVVFDALGTPSLANLLLSKIRSITDKPVLKVIVSHYHADHIYGLQVFKEQGAQIIAPKGAMDYLDSSAAEERLEERRFSLEPWVNETTVLVSPDVIVEKPMTFEHGGIRFTIDVLGAAHSDGDLTLYIEPERVLFSGDIIFEGRVPYLGDANTKTWLKTLLKMEVGKIRALIPGHGPAAKNPNQAISATRHYLARIRNVMSKAVENMDDFAETFDKTDWSEFEHLPAFNEAHRRNAYQVFLSMEAE